MRSIDQITFLLEELCTADEDQVAFKRGDGLCKVSGCRHSTNPAREYGCNTCALNQHGNQSLLDHIQQFEP